MIYLNTETKEYPRHNGDLELLGWVPGESLPENWVEVQYTEPPAIQEGQTYQQNFPIEIDGVWTITWTVRDLTDEEKIEIIAKQKELNNPFIL